MRLAMECYGDQFIDVLYFCSLGAFLLYMVDSETTVFERHISLLNYLISASN